MSLSDSESCESAAGPLVDGEWLAFNWYGQTAEALCRRKGLRYPHAGQASGLAARLPSLGSGHLAGVSPGLEGEQPPDVVVGGPCIGDCARFPTVEALYDSVQAIHAGRALGRPVLLFVGEDEEILSRGGRGKWPDVARRVERWLETVVDELGAGPVRIVRTASRAHREALAAVDFVGQASPGELDAVFHLGPDPPAVSGEVAREVARRVVAAHLPEVLAAYGYGDGRRARVLVAENLQQAGVYACARRLAEPRGGGVEMAAHWPAPGLSAAERMFRAESWDKVPARDLARLALGKLTGAHPRTIGFFAAWLDPGTRERLSARAGGW